MGSAFSIAYPMMELWLWGSFFLVVLLFLRWLGSKWQRLNWLICTRERWLLIWSWFGVIRVIGVAIILAIIQGIPVIDQLGWPAEINRYAFPAQFIEYLDIPILAVLSGGIIEAIIRCGFAAFAWWIYNWWIEKFRGHQTITKWEKCGMSLFAGAWLLGLANWIAFQKPYPPPELFVDFRGVPFAFFETHGGFFWTRQFVWNAAIGNALVMAAFSLCLAAIWIWISRKKLSSTIPDISHIQE